MASHSHIPSAPQVDTAGQSYQQVINFDDALLFGERDALFKDYQEGNISHSALKKKSKVDVSQKKHDPGFETDNEYMHVESSTSVEKKKGIQFGRFNGRVSLETTVTKTTENAYTDWVTKQSEEWIKKT